MINKKEIILHGLKRSGHHAVANWIFQQSPEHKCYINDVKLDRNPFLTRNAYSDIGDRKREKNGDFTKKELLLYTFEDKDITLVYSDYFLQNREVFVGDSENFYNMLVLRDPFNHFASRLRSLKKGCKWAWKEKTEAWAVFYVDLWKKQAKEFLGHTSYLPENKICVDFPKWTNNIEYRENIIEKIGLKFTDEGREEVVKAGGGSAFDNRKFDGKASEMKINDRWEEFVNDPYYLSLFDDEVLELSDKIWGKQYFEKAYNIIKPVAKPLQITNPKSSHKVSSIAIDLKNSNIFKDKPNHIPSILLDVAYYLQEEKGTKINICMIKQSKKAIDIFNETHNLNYTPIEKKRTFEKEEVDKTFSDIDFYLGFCGHAHRKKRKHFRQNNKPYLVYESGGLYNSLLIDPTSIYGDSSISKKFDSILENYPIGDTEQYCKHIATNDISKRTQCGNDKIPDEDFIFVPGQAINDTSITKCSSTGLLEFIDIVSNFAKKNNISVVFKPHPGLYDHAPRHGSEKQIEWCKKYDNIHIVNNSIHNICKKALFTATVNTSAVDCFVNNVPIYCCGTSYYMRTKSLYYNPNVEEGLQKMIDKDYDENLMKIRQLKTVSWIKDNWLIESLSPSENVKRIEKMANIIF
jgi:hypothetical protein